VCYLCSTCWSAELALIGGCSSFGYDVAPGLCFVGASRCLVVVNRGRRPESRRRRGSSGMQHGDVVDDNG
jgi:hypothetical protein